MASEAEELAAKLRLEFAETRRELDEMAEDVRGLRTEMTSMRQHMAGVVTLQELDHADVAALKSRLDRIERRLELAE